MGGKGAQIGAFFTPHDLVRVGDGDSAIGLFPVGLVSAAAVIAAAADAKVVVARDSGDATAADLANNFIGPDIIADQVAKAINGIGLTTLHIGKKGFESRQVG